MDREKLENQLAELPLYGYFFLKSDTLEFSPRVRHICQTECQMYGKTWACPPGVGTVEECRAKCLSYPDFLMIVTVTEVADIADMEATLATRPAHEAITNQVEALMRAQGVETYTLSTEELVSQGMAFLIGGFIITPLMGLLITLLIGAFFFTLCVRKFDRADFSTIKIAARMQGGGPPAR